MKEENKYYQPTIEEFHVGFEYEAMMIHEDRFLKHIVEELNHITGFSPPTELRVKHLDQEDIESFGWVHDENECYYDGNWGDIALYHSDGERKVRIVAYPHSPIKSSILFNGTIRNKSELKRVLTQIGVI
jgi:hypothetical protein